MCPALGWYGPGSRRLWVVQDGFEGFKGIGSGPNGSEQSGPGKAQVFDHPKPSGSDSAQGKNLRRGLVAMEDLADQIEVKGRDMAGFGDGFKDRAQQNPVIANQFGQGGRVVAGGTNLDPRLFEPVDPQGGRGFGLLPKV